MKARKTARRRTLRHVAKVKAHEYQDRLVLQTIHSKPNSRLMAAEIAYEMTEKGTLERGNGRTILPALRRLLAAGKITKRVVHRNTCVWGLPEGGR